jgi:hypothetical protein
VRTYRVLPIKPLAGTPDAAVVSALASMVQGRRTSVAALHRAGLRPGL